jgi:hypothetical protein
MQYCMRKFFLEIIRWQKIRDTFLQKRMLEYLIHTWSLTRIFMKHERHNLIKLIRETFGDSW